MLCFHMSKYHCQVHGAISTYNKSRFDFLAVFTNSSLSSNILIGSLFNHDFSFIQWLIYSKSVDLIYGMLSNKLPD